VRDERFLHTLTPAETDALGTYPRGAMTRVAVSSLALPSRRLCGSEAPRVA
jgi:hypothetical protein